MYVESREIAPINLGPGQEQRGRCGEWTCGHRHKGEAGMIWKIRVDINVLPCAKSIASGNLQYS